jgi:membrane protease YdiL (CAAX protease family)
MNILLAPDPSRPGRRRLRAAWRIAGQLGLLLLFMIILSVPLVILPLAGIPLGTNFLFLTSQAIGFIAITISVFIARRFLDQRPVRSLGLERGRAAADLFIGVIIAGVMMTLIFLIEWLGGWISIEGTTWQQTERLAGILVMFIVFIAVGWQEELLARGYLLRNLIDGLNPGWAVLISSAIFGLGHLGNPNVNPIAILGLLLAGVFFAFAALRSGQLWLPIGLHIGWNFFEGPVFGFPVSGLSLPTLIQQGTSPGADLFTGGAFGPEAGLILLPALALGAGLIWLWTRRAINL